MELTPVGIDIAKNVFQVTLRTAVFHRVGAYDSQCWGMSAGYPNLLGLHHTI